jgi:N-acetylglucosaminyldiphosphoundecaprenol N-acetyl-beta-D-mannosaminyltransferase
MTIKRTNILGVGVSAVNMQMAVAAIEGWIANRAPHFVCVATVNNITACQRDCQLRLIHSQSGMVTPDGMPLVWLSKLKGNGFVERVYGPDLMLAMCAVSAQKGYRNFLYGGAEGIADCLADRLGQRFPGLNIVGTDTPPFRPLTYEEDQATIKKINAAQPDIVWVGLSTPKQEHWMAAHIHKITAPVLIGVGAAFDFHAGVKKQAPLWMQRSGLEWMFRLASEPRRLWKRYLINNPWFIWLVLLQTLGLKRYTLEE